MNECDERKRMIDFNGRCSWKVDITLIVDEKDLAIGFKA
jgi:hypothetical protein